MNDVIMIFAFAPLVGLLLGISSITVPSVTLLTSVFVYIVVPVVLAQVLRRVLSRSGPASFEAALRRMGPRSIAALLAMHALLFAFQGEAIIDQPFVIAMLAGRSRSRWCSTPGSHTGSIAASARSTASPVRPP